VVGWVMGRKGRNGRLTVASLTMPYVSHKALGLNAALLAFVWSAERNSEFGLSRLLAGDIQL
jgi:hypothetical protein